MITRFTFFPGMPFCRILFGLLLVSAMRGAPSSGFVDQLSPAERAALRVDEMTPEQRAVLERAAARYAETRSAAPIEDVGGKSADGDLAAELQQTRSELKRTEQALAEAKATLEQPKPSMLDRAKVLLMPGTEIEYSTVESRLTEPFKGWQKGTLFRLENGQIWRVRSGEYWSPREDAGKAIKIVPGKLGSFFAKFDDVRSSPTVELIR